MAGHKVAWKWHGMEIKTSMVWSLASHCREARRQGPKRGSDSLVVGDEDHDDAADEEDDEERAHHAWEKF